MFDDKGEIKVGDRVSCNIFYTGISSKKYIEILKLIAVGKNKEVQKQLENGRKIRQMVIPHLNGEVIEIIPILQNCMVTVSYGGGDITLLDNCWTKKS